MSDAALASVKPTVSLRDRRHLTPDESRRLIEAAGKRGRYGYRDRVMLRLIYRHGLRAVEACQLRWSSIDLDRATIYVARVKGSDASTHVMDGDEVRDLRKLKQDSTSPYVFVTERGGPLSVDALQRIVRSAGEAAKLDIHAHPHMLRHATGYALANAETDVRLIQAFLGHRDIRNTVKYTAIAPNRFARVRVR